MRRAAHIALACLLLLGCTGTENRESPPSADDRPAVAEQRLADFDGLVTAIERMHPDPFGTIDERTWRKEAALLRDRVARMTADQFLTAVASVSILGDRNGHGGVFPTDQADLEGWPLRLYEFTDGWRIIDAADPGLVGARLDRIGGRPIDDVADAVATITPRDNEHSLRSRLGLYLVVPAFLRGLDQLGDGTLTVTDSTGTRTIPAPETVGPEELATLTGVVIPQIPPALPLRPPHSADDYFWSRREGGALVVGYERVLGRTPAGRYLEDFVESLRAEVARSGPRVVVVDLRRNPGGENERGAPFTDWLAEVAASGVPVRVLTSRSTYSAASFIFAELRTRAKVTFYGEATGGGSGTFGDPRRYRLSNTGIVVQVPTRWFSQLDNDVDAIEPDVRIPTTWADYAAGRDPVLAAALA